MVSLCCSPSGSNVRLKELLFNRFHILGVHSPLPSSHRCPSTDDIVDYEKQGTNHTDKGLVVVLLAKTIAKPIKEGLKEFSCGNGCCDQDSHSRVFVVGTLGARATTIEALTAGAISIPLYAKVWEAYLYEAFTAKEANNATTGDARGRARAGFYQNRGG